MRKTIVILVCLLLVASGVPLFAHGHTGHHHGWHNGHHWHGSSTHPSFHGWRGWGQHNPNHNPTEEPPAEEPTDPPDNPPQEDPGDKPGGGSGDGSGGKDGEIPMEWMTILNPSNGSIIG